MSSRVFKGDLISRSALRNEHSEKCYGECCYCTERDNESGECGLIQYAPIVDAVSPSVVEQYKWERDVAIAQLEELGIGFGQKKPDMVEVVRCKDCKAFGKSPWGNFPKGWCKTHGCHHGQDYYCASGKRKDAEVEG